MGEADDTQRQWILSQGGHPASFKNNRVVPANRFDDRVIRNKTWTLWVNTEWIPVQLYDLKNDPWEENNLIDSSRKDTRKAKKELMKVIKMIKPFVRTFSAFLIASTFLFSSCNEENPPPNVILIMTDDQGYGDLACHGNPIVKTPELDKLYEESIRFTDFHVNSFCAPTRAALLTGRMSDRTHVWSTVYARNHLNKEETTMAEFF